jgi:hypothetical protein
MSVRAQAPENASFWHFEHSGDGGAPIVHAPSHRSAHVPHTHSNSSSSLACESSHSSPSSPMNDAPQPMHPPVVASVVAPVLASPVLITPVVAAPVLVAPPLVSPELVGAIVDASVVLVPGAVVVAAIVVSVVVESSGCDPHAVTAPTKMKCLKSVRTGASRGVRAAPA